jgi:hypothetical protein
MYQRVLVISANLSPHLQDELAKLAELVHERGDELPQANHRAADF